MFRLLTRFAELAIPLLLSAGALATESVDAASADPRWQPSGAHLTLGEVLRIADAKFAQTVPTLVGFLKASEVSYRCEDKDVCRWTVAYNSIKSSLNVFVFINDRTRQTDLWPPPLRHSGSEK